MFDGCQPLSREKNNLMSYESQLPYLTPRLKMMAHMVMVMIIIDVNLIHAEKSRI